MTTRQRKHALIALLMCVVFSTPFLFLPPSSISAEEWVTPVATRSTSVLSALRSTNRVINGREVQYTINLASLNTRLISNMEAYIDTFPANSVVVERVRFNLRSAIPPRDDSRPLFHIYVINRHLIECESDIPFVIVRRSLDFIFAVRYFDNTMTFAVDTRNFDDIMAFFNTSARMRRFITFPAAQRLDYRNTAFFNGIPMLSPIRILPGERMVQLREAAELLGYTVEWHADGNIVVILRPDGVRRDAFAIFSHSTHHPDVNVQIRLINDRTYVSIGYFNQVLGRHTRFSSIPNNVIDIW